MAAIGSVEFRQHPLYGKIPLIPSTHSTADGRTYTFYEYDLNYAPDMPRGAVRGNIRQQNLCFQCNVPKYFYVDEDKTYIQCGEAFVFSAREQKFWYETLKFYGTSEAIRCPECRRMLEVPVRQDEPFVPDIAPNRDSKTVAVYTRHKPECSG